MEDKVYNFVTFASDVSKNKLDYHSTIGFMIQLCATCAEMKERLEGKQGKYNDWKADALEKINILFGE